MECSGEGGDRQADEGVLGEAQKSRGREVSIGSVYITLARLGDKGLVSSRVGEPTPERGGRAKTYFRITAKGLREVQQAQQTLTALWNGVPELQGEVA